VIDLSKGPSPFVCLFCPKNCILTIEKETVSGALCGEQDLFKKFYLTTTVKTSEGKRLPVKTRDRIPVSAFKDVMTALKGVTVSGSISIGQTIAQDVCGTGTDIIATMSIDQRT